MFHKFLLRTASDRFIWKNSEGAGTAARHQNRRGESRAEKLLVFGKHGVFAEDRRFERIVKPGSRSLEILVAQAFDERPRTTGRAIEQFRGLGELGVGPRGGHTKPGVNQKNGMARERVKRFKDLDLFATSRGQRGARLQEERNIGTEFGRNGRNNTRFQRIPK